MLHHISLNAHRPEKASGALAEMLGAAMLRAPTPPFLGDSWLVCMGDGPRDHD